MEMRGTPHSHIMEPPPSSSSSSSRSRAGIGNQRDKWQPGCWAVVAPGGRAGTAATLCLWVARVSSSPARRDTSKGEDKSRKVVPTVLAARHHARQGHGVHRGTQHVPSPALGLQGRPGHTSQPPFPSCIHCGTFWGQRGSSRSRAGRVCLACGPGDGGQPLLSEGVCTCSCYQQGEIKIYLYSGGFGHCRRSSGGCQGGGEIGVPSWRSHG